MKRFALLTALVVCGVFGSACDLSPQPLPPSNSASANPTGTSGGSSSGSSLAGSAGVDAADIYEPDSSNGRSDSSPPLDVLVGADGATTPPVDGATDAPEDQSADSARLADASAPDAVEPRPGDAADVPAAD